MPQIQQSICKHLAKQSVSSTRILKKLFFALQDCYPTKNSDKLAVKKFNNNFPEYEIMDSQKNKTLNNTLRDIYESRYNELPRLFKLFKQEKEQSSAINLATLLFNLSKLIPGKINNVQKKCFIEVVRLIPSPRFNLTHTEIYFASNPEIHPQAP